MTHLKKSSVAMWTTLGIIIGGALLFAGYTAYAATDPYADNTISNTTLLLQLVFPVVTAALGILMGHLTWPRAVAVGPELWCISLLFIALLGQALFGQWLRAVPLPVIFAVNYVLSHYLWPQSATTVENAKRILPFL